jgi:hypothetical protein
LYGKKKLAEECEAWCREHKTCNTEIIKHAITIADANPASREPEVIKATKRDERLAERGSAERKRKLLRFAKRAGTMTAVAATAVGIVWYIANRPDVPDSELIARGGMHWHAELTIAINGKQENIPVNIGIGAVHNPIHTHDSDNKIHMEFTTVVRQDDIRLKKFFEVWGKPFNREQILDHRNGSEGTVKMFVNGESSDQFENYVMQDKDKIEIRYEQ